MPRMKIVANEIVEVCYMGMGMVTNDGEALVAVLAQIAKISFRQLVWSMALKRGPPNYGAQVGIDLSCSSDPPG